MKPFDSKKYYNHLPIKPGCLFYSSLLPYKSKLKQLHLNVPIALFPFEQINYLIYTSNSGFNNKIAKENYH